MDATDRQLGPGGGFERRLPKTDMAKGFTKVSQNGGCGDGVVWKGEGRAAVALKDLSSCVNIIISAKNR